jgi:hypothetical protein
VIEQVPAVTIVAVVPDTVHTLGVVEAKLTDRPEVAVALNANEPALYDTGPGFGNEIVWLALLIVMSSLTGVAAV